MSVPLWQPGKLYQPGDLVRPTETGDVTQTELTNPGFEADFAGWTITGAGTQQIVATAFAGAKAARINDNGLDAHCTITNDARLPCAAGQLITIRNYVRCDGDPGATRALLKINWYTAGGSALAPSLMAQDGTVLAGVHVRINSFGLIGLAADDVWAQIECSGIAPANAVTFTAELALNWLPDGAWIVDEFEVVYADQAAPSSLLFRAVQDDAGFSGNNEPEWPDTVGLQVLDNEVTWEAVSGTNVTWEAHRILVSGPTEPTWPLAAGARVVDATISWELDTRRVRDENAPGSPIAVIAASKVFAPDGDIVNYSATVNPLDWTTPDDAGYIPFGLQRYGANPVAAMGLYRGNLVAFNSQGCQIWQVDEDPEAITLLDAIPVPCTFAQSLAPVGDDLALLTNVGIRSLGIAGSAVNLQMGYFGKQIDPLVVASIKTATAAGIEPKALYWPASGQFWLFFGSIAYVLTLNGPGKDGRSWSRYIFPSAVDYWTILGENLYLRSGNLVWLVSADETLDDVHDVGGSDVGDEFTGVIQWPHLDMNSLGQDKELLAFDLFVTGMVDVSVGYDHKKPDFDALGPWTSPYEVDGDTVTGQHVPFSVTGPSLALRLEFHADQAWEFYAANLHIKDTVD